MEDIEFKKIGSGRVRGRSILSILRATEQEHGGGDESQSAGESKYQLKTPSKSAINQSRSFFKAYQHQHTLWYEFLDSSN